MTINKAKAICTFEIENNETTNKFYQYFRIRMTGENSFKRDKKQNSKKKTWSIVNLKGVLENTKKKEFILCCAGIELYGNIVLGDNYNELKDMELPKEFEYQYDFDKEGILYWIGTNFGQNPEKYNNPSSNLFVKVERGKQSEKGSVDDIVGRKKVEECHFLDYFIIDFRDIRVKGNKYSLKLDQSYNEMMINTNDGLLFSESGSMNRHSWSIKASNNKRDWKIIYEHIDDTTFGNGDFDEEPLDTATFNINCDDYYRYFKIENMTLLKELHCSGFEIYGSVKYNKLKYKLPKLKSGGNGGGIINLISPKCRLNDCILSANGQNGINFGGGGAGGNILIDTDRLEILGENTKITCIGGKGHNNVKNNDSDKLYNDGENGRIRLFANQIYGDNTPQKCCNPQPLIL